MRVLDLMSSWVSHLPEYDLDATGLGLNAEEMGQNPRLATHVVHDLNGNPELPFADGEFDAVVCTASVEYLIQPHDVFRSVRRVLKPGAPFVVTFSDRWFSPKAIQVWPLLHAFERMGLCSTTSAALAVSARSAANRCATGRDQRTTPTPSRWRFPIRCSRCGVGQRN